jgi:hypothetical protein
MKKYIVLHIFILFLGVQIAQSQQFDTKQQYNQAMANAKQAFEAKQFSEAVMFYREAIKINPEARLPKYKIEDIRTIYIEKEIDNKLNAKAKQPKKKKLTKKEAQVEKLQVKQLAEQEATRKMNEDADKATAELQNLNVEVVDINETLEDIKDESSMKIDPVEDDKDAKLAIKATKVNESDDDFHVDETIQIDEVEAEKPAKISIKATEVQESDDDLLIEDTDNVEKLDDDKKTNLSIRVVEVNNEIEELDDDSQIEIVEQKAIPEELPQKRKIEPIKIVKIAPSQPKQMSAEEKEKWIEKEKNRLAQVYPNKKNIEEIEKPGKQITRVIMNIDNKVTVYLKVKHSWGATYFFIDDVGQELRSINQQYFNLMTNLKTYGN